jgi:hypothetical protein
MSKTLTLIKIQLSMWNNYHLTRTSLNAVDNDEEISFKSAVAAAANLDHHLVPMMTAERVHRISLKTYCMVVIDGI